MKDTLQLHEIVGYLPYGLECRLSHEGMVNLDSDYPNEHQHKAGVIKHFSFYDDEFSGSFWVTDKYSFDFEEQSEIEILLRPMFDLKAVQFDELRKITSRIEIGGYIWFSGAVSLKIVQEVNNWLYRNHFDIHNLIGRGLAIDINTLKEQA